jgi:hypothetical protein
MFGPPARPPLGVVTSLTVIMVAVPRGGLAGDRQAGLPRGA